MTETQWSVPESEVLRTVGEIITGDRRGVLATIIDVDGSAYRRPGAKMVIPEGGEGIGHITAGCLEDELQRLSGDVLDAGVPRVETYDLRPEEDDDVWGLGVGCNGILDILLEPLDDSYAPVVEALDTGDNIGVLTVIDAPDGSLVGSRAYYAPDEDAFDLDGAFPAHVADELREAVAELTANGRADTLEVGETRVFVDGIRCPDDLVVIGTGHDIGPIAELGTQADFRVTILGFRGANAKSERFPSADEVRSTSPARLREAFDFGPETYVIVATHNFLDDRLALEELLETPVPYIGLMGPRERFEEILDELETEGRSLGDDELDRIYTPVGLDLGGGSPHQIAISIVAEVLTIANDREPRHLKTRAGPIHDRVSLSADGGEE